MSAVRFGGLALAVALVLWPLEPLLAQDVESATTYRVTFTGTWTTAATPGGVPGSAHFSPLVGASHNGNVVFWQAGAKASAGVEDVAELGATGGFINEINASGHALAVITRGLGSGATPSANVDFEVSSDYPLVTLLTMIAPSPDWFVGVSGLSLRSAGQWRERVEVNLYPYDAGTEDGDGFSLSNPATVPQGVITSIRGTGKFTNEPMARLTFVCLSGCTTPPPPPPPPPPDPDPPPEPIVRNVPLFPSTTDTDGREGFVRVINYSSEVAEVEVVAIDDSGVRSEALTLSVAGGETVHFNSEDLETGNDMKGLPSGTGARAGHSRLELATDLDIEVLAYVRGKDGFLTSMHDLVPSDGDVHRVAMFNPGKNQNQKSLLRLINPGAEEAAITIEGIDDRGTASDRVRLTLPAGAAVTVSAAALESDGSRDDLDLAAGGGTLEGELGTGTGKWRLVVNSDQPISVMSLLASPSRHLTNLSTAPDSRAAMPATGESR